MSLGGTHPPNLAIPIFPVVSQSFQGYPASITFCSGLCTCLHSVLSEHGRCMSSCPRNCMSGNKFYFCCLTEASCHDRSRSIHPGLFAQSTGPPPTSVDLGHLAGTLPFSSFCSIPHHQLEAAHPLGLAGLQAPHQAHKTETLPWLVLRVGCLDLGQNTCDDYIDPWLF